MSNKKKLWNIFGPVLCAFLLLWGVLSIPWQRTFSKKSIYEAANSQTTTVFKGIRMKQAAFRQNYVPFYGSSELSRIDPLHPSIIAEKYKRTYRPFLLGGAGSQSLAQFMGMQGTSQQLAGKKAVMIISPQWFTKDGQDPNAFTLYYSALQGSTFLLNAQNTKTDRYAAQRLLEMPTIKTGIIKNDLQKIANGEKLSKFDKLILRNQQRILLSEDTFFTSFQLRNRVGKIRKKEKLLPNNYSIAGLTTVANSQAKQHTTSNNLGISNAFYRTRLARKSTRLKLKGSQKDFNYTQSVEYADFELVLNKFAQQHTDVLFIIPPINAKWAKYTGLSQKMYQNAVKKMKYQLESQGFTNIADFSKDGAKKYFMEDTIHLGWNGWIAVDKVVNPFLSKKSKSYNYKLNNYFYSTEWQNKPSQ